MEITNEKERIFFFFFLHKKERIICCSLHKRLYYFNIFDCEEKREKIVKIKRRGIYSFDLYIDRQVFMCPSTKKKSLCGTIIFACHVPNFLRVHKVFEMFILVF